jgi:cyclophilin family peptidyl-prolyl cis-trans isomerase
MNKKFASLSIILSSLLLCACGPSTTQNNNINLDQTPPTITSMPTSTSTSSAKTTPSTDTLVGLTTKDGQIVIKLYRQQTPNTVATFLKKVNSGFYNGLTFHRVISGFMAQGGDPTGTGTGGGSQPSELNKIPFVRGSLGLARTPASKDISNDSQFFICFTTDGCQHLTGDYVNFGEVVNGLDILDKIQQGDKILKISTQTK